MNIDMCELRAQYMARKRTHPHVGGYALIDVYLFLYAVSCIINEAVGIQTPFMWLTDFGGFDCVEADQIENLSELLYVKNIPGNHSGRIISGITVEGVQFLKEHIKELSDDLPLFSLSEEVIISLDISKGVCR